MIVITELVGGLTASFKSVWDAFQVGFDGARRNPRAKLIDLRLNDRTRFRRLGDVNACLTSKCGNDGQERCPLELLQRSIESIGGIARFRWLLFFGPSEGEARLATTASRACGRTPS